MTVPGRREGLPIEPLWEAERPDVGAPFRGGELPPELSARYPGGLSIPLRPVGATVIANFVSSVDGVVALGPTERSIGGGEISGNSEPDRLVMSLLRGLADAVVVGAGTIRVGRNHEWTARHLQPGLADVFARWRAELGLAAQPTTIVVSGSGNVDPSHAAMRAPDVPVVVLTTEAGAARLTATRLPKNLSVLAAGPGDRVEPTALTDLLERRKIRLALCEGGPRLLGELVSGGLVDELFLTIAPQLIGRTDALARLGLVEGADLRTPATWIKPSGVRRAGDELFLRYRFDR
jgi:riboflavin biosynthesis pyrimidine reductase